MAETTGVRESVGGSGVSVAGSSGPVLCGFGFRSHRDGKTLGSSKPGNDTIFYCTENGLMNSFLPQKFYMRWGEKAEN